MHLALFKRFQYLSIYLLGFYSENTAICTHECLNLKDHMPVEISIASHRVKNIFGVSYFTICEYEQLKGERRNWKTFRQSNISKDYKKYFATASFTTPKKKML